MSLRRWLVSVLLLLLWVGIPLSAVAQGGGPTPLPPGVKPNQQCAPGSFVTGIDAAGHIICVSIPGGGDMLRATYDADLDGEVTLSELARALNADPVACGAGLLVRDIAPDGTLNCVSPPPAAELDTGTAFPGAPTVKRVFIVSDDSAVGACDSAGGTAVSFCYWNGSTWVSPGRVSSVFGRTGAVVATAGDYTATLVTNTPAGTIAATTVQAALNELDTEKSATGHTHATTDVTSGRFIAARLLAGTAGLPLVGAGGSSDPAYAALGVAGIDATVIQQRVTATCSAGSSIRIIAQDGTVTCEPDDIGAGGGGYDTVQTDSGSVAKTAAEQLRITGAFGIDCTGTEGTPDIVSCAIVDSEMATQTELNNKNVETFPTAGASGTAPVSGGATLTMTNIATQAELDTHAALPDVHHAKNHPLLDNTIHTIVGATDGYVLQATGGTTFEMDWPRTRSAANCQTLTDGETGEVCINSVGVPQAFRCVQSIGLCDTTGEWPAIGILEANVTFGIGGANDGTRHDHIPADIVNGTLNKCAHFNASGVLEAATGDCPAGDTGGTVGGTVGTTGLVQFAGATTGEHDSENTFSYDKATNRLTVGLLGASPQPGTIATVPPAATGSSVALTESTNGCSPDATTLANCQSITFQSPATIAAGASNAHCTATGLPSACCTGAGTGTCTGRTIVLSDSATPIPGTAVSAGGAGITGSAGALVISGDSSHTHTTTSISDLDATDTASGIFADDRINGNQERDEVSPQWTALIDRADYPSNSAFMDAYWDALEPMMASGVQCAGASSVRVRVSGTLNVQYTADAASFTDLGDVRVLFGFWKSPASTPFVAHRPDTGPEAGCSVTPGAVVLDWSDLIINYDCTGQNASSDRVALVSVGSEYFSGFSGPTGGGQLGNLGYAEVRGYPKVNFTNTCQLGWEDAGVPRIHRIPTMLDDPNFRSNSTAVAIWLNGNPATLSPNAPISCRGGNDIDDWCLYASNSYGSSVGPVVSQDPNAVMIDQGNNGLTIFGDAYSTAGVSTSLWGLVGGNPKGVSPVDGACDNLGAGGCTERAVGQNGITIQRLVTEAYHSSHVVIFDGGDWDVKVHSEGLPTNGNGNCSAIFGAGICSSDDSICTINTDCSASTCTGVGTPGPCCTGVGTGTNCSCHATAANVELNGEFGGLWTVDPQFCFGPGNQIASGPATSWGNKSHLKITGVAVAQTPKAPIIANPPDANFDYGWAGPTRQRAHVDLSGLSSDKPIPWPANYDGRFTPQHPVLVADDCTSISPVQMQQNGICIDKLTTNLGHIYRCQADGGGAANQCDNASDLIDMLSGAEIGAATATTPGASDNSTRVATTAFVTGSTVAFTGKTYDAEGTGNVFKLMQEYPFDLVACDPVGGCLNLWGKDGSTPAGALPAVVSVDDTKLGRPAASYNGTVDNCAIKYWRPPTDWVPGSQVDLDLLWSIASTTNNVCFTAALACTADTELTGNNAFNTETKVVVSLASGGASGATRITPINNLTTTGCAAGESMALRLCRNGDNGTGGAVTTASCTDDNTVVASVYQAILRLRRSQ